MRITYFYAVVFVLLYTPSIQADTEAPKILLGPYAKSLKVGPKMDARGLNLEGTVIVGHDLSGAQFDSAKLRGARISDCDLFGASFQGADLRGSTFSDCRIAGADFTDALINGIIGANHFPGRQALEFSRTQLTATASFKRKDLSACEISTWYAKDPFDFREFDLRGSSLNGDFSRSKFAGAQIRKARFSGVFPIDEIRKTRDFRSGDVIGEFACPKSLDLSNTVIRESSVFIGETSILKGATLDRCHHVRFLGSSASSILPTTKSYKDGTLAYNSFANSDMSDLNLDRMNLTSCVFIDCNLANTTFKDSVVSRADFREAKGLTVEQIESTWNFKNDRMSDVQASQGGWEAQIVPLCANDV